VDFIGVCKCVATVEECVGLYLFKTVTSQKRIFPQILW